MMDLIARLEAAEYGNRELDEAVWLACGQERQITGPVNNGVGVWNGPHVSHFIDPAMKLAELVLGRVQALALLSGCVEIAGSTGMEISRIPLLICAGLLYGKLAEEPTKG